MNLVNDLEAQLRASEARYWALLQEVASGRAMLSTPLTVIPADCVLAGLVRCRSASPAALYRPVHAGYPAELPVEWLHDRGSR